VQDIAKTIRRGWSPELTKAMQLPEQARRLDRALKVAVKWMEAAREDSTDMFHQAEYTRDKIEEELSRVCFEMAVESEAGREKAASAASRDYTDENLSAIARSAALTNTLLAAYCTLRELESDLFGDGSPRARYEVMGALMVAVDAASAKTERLDAANAPGEPEKATA
jgi:hypothetical protein